MLKLIINVSQVFFLLYFIQMWRDERLQWEPTEYNNLTELIVEAKRLWRPEFAVINGYVV